MHRNYATIKIESNDPRLELRSIHLTNAGLLINEQGPAPLGHPVIATVMGDICTKVVKIDGRPTQQVFSEMTKLSFNRQNPVEQLLALYTAVYILRIRKRGIEVVPKSGTIGEVLDYVATQHNRCK